MSSREKQGRDSVCKITFQIKKEMCSYRINAAALAQLEGTKGKLKSEDGHGMKW